MALAGERTYQALPDLLQDAGPDAFVVMLDGMEDPYNFGQAVRSLYACGATASSCGPVHGNPRPRP